jgi:SAM-dependent methyltransferase
VADEEWLAATWPFVREHLPVPPARVVELGCGPLGGFVPRMRALGYEAFGVDPEAPTGAEYEQIEFEHRRPGPPLDAVVACTSLHHVTDLDLALDRISSQLKPAGRVVIVEWAHEEFDEPTARWCFDRLTPSDDDHESWLHAHRHHWQQSGQPWDAYFQAWIAEEHLHTGRAIMHALQTRFETRAAGAGPLFFADLDGVMKDDEQSAIDAGLIRANGLHFVGIVRSP